MAKKTISPELKIVLEAFKEERHLGDIVSEHGIHSTTIKRWCEELMASADKVYASTEADKQAAQARIDQEKQIDILYAQIGRLTTQLYADRKDAKMGIRCL
ncbi:MAG: hypothetical protein QM401_01260 [Bacillota bacterium]|nr:hypothetical protein [Bacillota bacterium]